MNGNNDRKYIKIRWRKTCRIFIMILEREQNLDNTYPVVKTMEARH